MPAGNVEDSVLLHSSIEEGLLLAQLRRQVSVTEERWQTLYGREDCWFDPVTRAAMFKARMEYQDACLQLHTRIHQMQSRMEGYLWEGNSSSVPKLTDDYERC